jgi:hypothetical protein
VCCISACLVGLHALIEARAKAAARPAGRSRLLSVP